MVRAILSCTVLRNRVSITKVVGAPMRAAVTAAVRIWQGPQRAEASLLAEHACDWHVQRTGGENPDPGA
jgi:hypothetical protein